MYITIFLLPYFLLDLTLLAPVCVYQHVKYPWVPKSFASLRFYPSYSTNVSILYLPKFKDFTSLRFYCSLCS